MSIRNFHANQLKEITQPVAIKRLKSHDPRQVQMLIDEICLWAKLESEYIVMVIGASWTRPIDMECILVYMDLDNLRTHLSNIQRGNLIGIKSGKSYLSLYLFTTDYTLRSQVTVKGTSKLFEYDECTITRTIGTYRWMAPEFLSGNKYSLAADIYSFEIIFCLNFVHMNCHIQTLTKGGVYPLFGDKAPEWVKVLAIRCLQLNRPTTLELSVMLPNNIN
ncbi:hypothetical protein THRCLA_22069 [Thraustotheca clavata]|uniref:Protein kinase domain-containing protein n=1 Tax=Thraustotheca clavata TaxID=74557 RepID=A0A1V9ZCX5_9STRA|nr:hypothetical protein THRCLA_22069 [Thraustotheca clavata]